MTERIGSEVRRELARFSGPDGGMPEVVAAWAAAVGPEIARNAWPARISRDGTLHVAASSSVWAFELGQLEATVRERLRVSLGSKTPGRLRFAVGRVPEPEPDPSRAPRRPPPPGPEHLEQASRLAAGIADGELREAVSRAAAASLAAAGTDRAFW